MTREEIKKQRDFLDDKHRYRGYHDYGPVTTKPCPGCGASGREHRRIADQVCNHCRDLILESLALRDRRAKQTDYRPYKVQTVGFYEGHHPHFPSICWSNTRDPEEMSRLLDTGDSHGTPIDPGSVIEELMHQLAHALSAELPPLSKWDAEEYLFEARSNTADDDVLFLRPEHTALLRCLDKSIRKALLGRSEAGVLYGRNLIAQLATGELTIQQYNDLSREDR